MWWCSEEAWELFTKLGPEHVDVEPSWCIRKWGKVDLLRAGLGSLGGNRLIKPLADVVVLALPKGSLSSGWPGCGDLLMILWLAWWCEPQASRFPRVLGATVPWDATWASP